ncbi:hypothetical protein HK105_206869 [Polyrhizophydium stewartii]|uniref:Ankyrin repeat protein n=1 Tax=Polyrhizophydium stewartii TaxID=2732419 RepID=A0ABR4N221_9FUNG
MLGQPGIRITESAVNRAAWRNAIGIINIFVAADSRWLEHIADLAATRGSVDMIEWLNVRHRGAISQRTLRLAVKGGSVKLVRFLLETVRGIDWDIAAARSDASGPWKNDLCDVLDAFELVRLVSACCAAHAHTLTADQNL